MRREVIGKGMRKRDKIGICFLLFLLIFSFFTITYGTSSEIEISNFLNTIKGYQNDFIPELSNENIWDSVISGNIFKESSLFQRILNVFIHEIKDSIKIIFSIIAVSLLCAILKNIQSSFDRKCE